MWININTNDKELLQIIRVLDIIYRGYLEEEDLAKSEKSKAVIAAIDSFIYKLFKQLYTKTKDKKLKQRILAAHNRAKENQNQIISPKIEGENNNG